MDDVIRARIAAIEREIANQVDICLLLDPVARTAIRVDLGELCRQRRQLQKLLVADSEVGKAA